MSDFAEWVLELVKKLVQPAWDFFTDFLIATLALVLKAVVALIALLPGFDGLSGGLQTFYGSLPSGIAYCLAQMGMPTVLAMIGSAFAFRLARKIFTLFQW